MTIERLVIRDNELYIGITEIRNTNSLDTDNLLDIAKTISKSVFAFQFFNSLMIVDKMHLLSSAQNAVNAMKGEYMISRSLDVELVVYASTQHQIGIALDIMGVKDQLASIAVVCIDEVEEKVRKCIADVIEKVGEEVSPMFNPTATKISSLMETFGVSELEMKQFTDATDLISWSQALSKCIVSRVSMVSLAS